MDHLTELRSRLIRAVIAVCVLGVLSLAFSRTIFGLLMKPVLDALPPDARSLIYTSGVEEINVLMKVGLYAGVFFATPVVLWQVWGFVAPGLFPHERKYAAPFVILGTLAFVAGTAFAYFVMLPTMFNFLLGGGDNAELDGRVKAAEAQEQEVVRYVRIGDLPHALELAHESSEALAARGDAQVEARDDAGPEHSAEVSGRILALGRMVDALHQGFPSDAAPLRNVMEKRLAAWKAYQTGHADKASVLLDEAAELLLGKEGAQPLLPVWHFEKHVALAKGRYLAAAWTRPMLSMSEQLTLVLVLELAVGIIFELPLVMALLASLGLVKAKWLMKYQRHAFIVCLVLAAVITPTGDPVNLSLMAGPMILCYELGVLAAWLIEKRRGNKTDAIVPAPKP